LNNPCLNHGICVSVGKDFSCECLDGFSGKNCGQLGITVPQNFITFVCTFRTVFLANPIVNLNQHPSTFRPTRDSVTLEYPNNADQQWLANLTSGQLLNIRFPSIEYSADCDRDYLEVIVEDANGKSNTLGPYEQ